MTPLGSIPKAYLQRLSEVMVMTSEQAVRVDSSNTEQARAWDGDEGAYWAAHAERFDAGIARYHRRLLDTVRIDPGHRVLDIGCGAGQTTRDAARLATEGSVLGVDLSSQMLDVARRVAEEERLTNVSFVRADAQVYPFTEASFDVALSRAGSMFFGDPAAAFSNIARALRPDGELFLLVWRDLSHNEWVRELIGALAAGRDLQPPPPTAPGPFALSDPGRVTGLLTGAGFDEPTFEPLSEPMWFGRDVDDASRFVLGLMGWMLEGLDDSGRVRAVEALHATCRAHQIEGGVEFGSGAWLVTTQKAARPAGSPGSSRPPNGSAG